MVDGKKLSWFDAFEYISAAKGADVMIELWDKRHKDARNLKGPFCVSQPQQSLAQE